MATIDNLKSETRAMAGNVNTEFDASLIILKAFEDIAEMFNIEDAEKRQKLLERLGVMAVGIADWESEAQSDGLPYSLYEIICQWTKGWENEGKPIHLYQLRDEK